MIRFSIWSVFIIVVIAVLQGCSTSANLPSSVGLDLDQEMETFVPSADNSQTGRYLIGYYSMKIDPSNMTAIVIPDRETSGHFNLLGMLPVRVRVNGFNPETSSVDVDVAIKNPFNIDGYDLRLIIFQNVGHKLLNADNWTHLYDLPGGLPVNPFKAYAKTEPNRKFAAFSEYSENFLIQIPGGNFNVKFAIDVSWPGNCLEPYEISNYFQGYLYNQVGSKASVYIDVLDWQNNINKVRLYCPDLTNQVWVDFTYLEGNTYKLELINARGGPEPEKLYFGIIEATSQDLSLYLEVIILVTREKTIGTIYKDRYAWDGYTLISPLAYWDTWLVDMDGRVINCWSDDDEYLPGMAVYLLENGHLLKTCNTHGPEYPVGVGGKIKELDWDSQLLWDYDIQIPNVIPHHDIEMLPNGNVLFIAWEKKTRQEALDAGRNAGTLPDSELWPDSIFEVMPDGPTTGQIVWVWRTWNHLSSVNGGIADGQPVSTDISDPGKLDINFFITPIKDWLHCNAVDYNPDLDQIIITSRHFSEFWVIDHSTVNYMDPQAGIDAAKGPAGDILYRWGNPQAYHMGTEGDQVFFMPHDAYWIEPDFPGAGNILTFNNGVGRPLLQYSSVDEIVPPVDEFGDYTYIPGSPYGPADMFWMYFRTDNPTEFFSGTLCGSRRLSNGNTLICEGETGHIFEVKSNGAIVWEYINPVNHFGRQHQGITNIQLNHLFRAIRYEKDYPAFTEKDMTPKYYLELP